MRALLICLLALLPAFPLPTMAKGEKAGAFDYYVVALSWSPNWCELEGDARNSPQCDAAEDHGWILHGLWPQMTQSFPSYCRSTYRMPSKSMTANMADIMGTSRLAWHQWRKHGVCSGLSPSDYYALSRAAYARINRPAVFRKLERDVKLPTAVVEDAFLKANPDMEPGGITITCKQGHIQEARICLSRDLQPVQCGRDVVHDCTMTDALFTPIR